MEEKIVEIISQIKENDLKTKEYSVADTYLVFYQRLTDTKKQSKKAIDAYTQEMYGFLVLGDKKSVLDDNLAEQVREFLQETILEKRKTLFPLYDTSMLRDFISFFKNDKNLRFYGEYIPYLEDILYNFENVHLLAFPEYSESGSLIKEINWTCSRIRKRGKANYDLFVKGEALESKLAEIVQSILKQERKG